MFARRLLLIITLAAPAAVVHGQVAHTATPVLDDQPLAADAHLETMLTEAAALLEVTALPAPPWRAILDDPRAHHGHAFRLTTGPAMRVAQRAFGIDGLSAWQFASPEVDEPILLLLHEPRGKAAPGDRVGSIAVAAFFHKTALATLRRAGGDPAIAPEEGTRGSEQRILIFIGANPVYSPVDSEAWRGWSGAVVAVAAALVMLWIARLVLSKRRTSARSQAAALSEPERWNDANLPAEPADALAELRRRAGDTMTHER